MRQSLRGTEGAAVNFWPGPPFVVEPCPWGNARRYVAEAISQESLAEASALARHRPWMVWHVRDAERCWLRAVISLLYALSPRSEP